MRTFVIGLVLTGAAAAEAAPEPVLTLEHGGPVSCVAFSADGATLASGGGKNHANIRIWDLGEREEIVEITAHRAGITGLAFTPDGKYLASCGWDAQVYLWEVATGQQVRCFAGHDEGVTGLAISPHGTLLATGSLDGVARLFELATGKELHRFKYRHRDKWDRVLAVTFSSDGSLLGASEDQEPRIRLWDVRTAKEVYRRGTSKHTPTTQQLYDDSGYHFSPRGIVLRNPDRFFRASRGIQLRQYSLYEHLFDDFAIDGHTLAYGVDTRLMFLESATGQDRLELRREVEVTALSFAPHGCRIACAEGKDGAVYLWNLEDLVGVPRPDGKLSTDQLATCWRRLGRDAATAYRATWQLSFSPDQAIPFLLEQTLDKNRIDPKMMDALLADLDGPTFAGRQRAAAKLQVLGPAALAALRRALAAQPSLEMTRRAERLVVLLEEELTFEAARGMRVVETLERIGGPPAQAALAQLARGPLLSGPDVEEAAGHALARLRRRERGQLTPAIP